MKWLIVVLVSLLSPSHSTEHGEKPVVETLNGQVRGYEMTSRSGRPFYAFTKIPYAKPPVGTLRFKNPEPTDDWKGVLEADKNLPDCWQIPVYDPFRKNLTLGTEDCLYLSVFAPKISEEAKLPVMVFIHGGGWRSELPANGQASRSKYLMDEDVVLVMMHYRLGPLGFMSFEDSVLPGNLGLKDQALSIEWVSKNIDKFGGDPQRITLFGNSAGAASTHYHLISPMTKHLVQAGISESGVANCLWALSPPGVAAERAHQVAKHLNCDSESTEEIVSCLQTKPAHDITDSERLFKVGYYNPNIPFMPIVEKGTDNAFLSVSPYKVAVEKPWIIGVTSEDGAVLWAHFLTFPELKESFKEHGVEILPSLLSFDKTTPMADEISQTIFSKYYGETNSDEGATNLFTDGLFTFGIEQALKLSNGPTYMYLFSYKGKKTSLSGEGEHDFTDLGVSHTDELLYLFNFEDENNDPDMKTEKDVAVSKSVVKLWTDFAKNSKITEYEWPIYNSEDKKYLNISHEFSVGSNLWPERSAFWNDLKIRANMDAMGL